MELSLGAPNTGRGGSHIILNLKGVVAQTCGIWWQLTVMLWGVCEYFVYNYQPGGTYNNRQRTIISDDIVMGRWNMDKN